MEMEVEMGSTKWAQHSAMGQAAASNAGACREAAGAEAEPPAAAHSAKGQAATASNLRWRVLTVDDTMFAPPQPQEGETEQRVNHKRTIKEGAVPADPAYYFAWCIHYLLHLDVNTKCYSVRHVSMAYQDTHPHHECSGASRFPPDVPAGWLRPTALAASAGMSTPSSL